MVLEILAVVISGISLFVSIFLGAIKYKEYKESKPKIKIEILSQGYGFRKRTNEEEKNPIYSNQYNNNKLQTIPQEILTFDINFKVKKIGIHPLIIDKIYYYWKYPLFDNKDLGKYILVNNTNNIYGSNLLGDWKDKFEPIEIKNMPINIRKHLEISPFLTFDLENHKREFKEKNLEKYGKNIFQYDYMKDYINLPPRIVLEIIIIDIKGKRTTKEAFFYPTIPKTINPT